MFESTSPNNAEFDFLKKSPNKANGTAHVAPLGMAVRKYQYQGETPQSLDLFSTPLK